MSSSSLQLPATYGGRSIASDPQGYERMRKRLEGMLKKMKVDVAVPVVETGNDVEEGIGLTSACPEVGVEEGKVGHVFGTWRARELTDPLYLKRLERIKELKKKFNKRSCLKSGSNSAVAQTKLKKTVHWGSKHETIFAIPNVDDCQKVYLLAEDLKALRRKLKKTRSERVEELRLKFSGLEPKVVVESTSTFGRDRTNSSINGVTTQRSRIPRLSIGK